MRFSFRLPCRRAICGLFFHNGGMIMTHDLFTFTGRKPSFTQCMAQAKRMAKAGRVFIELQWGENWLQLEKSQNYWQGYGFIRDIDAGIIARELNHSGENVEQFMRDHFQIVHIR